MKYEIQLADSKVKPHQTTALHLMIGLVLFAIGTVSSVLYWFTGISPKFKDAYSPFGLFGMVCLLAGIGVFVIAVFNKKWLRRSKANLGLRIAELVLLLGGAGIFYFAGWQIPAGMFAILGLAVVFALFWEQSGSRPQLVTFDEKGVHLPFPSKRRRLSWWEVERVLLRHGVLTVDCVDNHLYQWNIPAQSIDPGTFEQDCSARIEAATGERGKNNW